ncbi:hypothetical protein HOLleu_18192 [Holothuria leucospilota]|uniref:Uncharacterized protein n=1 Tax=Holothuria leucospilota TaxID=206669 RepID=A0A9Q1C358_HOLLE|nr:hypothetical protein HOLleu_18192 [Holothuria leucospilota]
MVSSIAVPYHLKESFWTSPRHNVTEESQTIGGERSPSPLVFTGVIEPYAPLSWIVEKENNNSRNLNTPVPAEISLNALDEYHHDNSDDDVMEECDSDTDSVIDTSESCRDVTGDDMTMCEMTKVTAKCHWLTKRYRQYTPHLSTGDIAEKKPALNHKDDIKGVKFRLQAMALLTSCIPLEDETHRQEPTVNNSSLLISAEEGRLPWTQTAVDKEADVIPCWSEEVHSGVSDLVRATVEVECEVSTKERVDHMKRIEFQRFLALRRGRRRRTGYEQKTLRGRYFEYSRSKFCPYWPPMDYYMPPMYFYCKDTFYQWSSRNRVSWQMPSPYCSTFQRDPCKGHFPPSPPTPCPPPPPPPPSSPLPPSNQQPHSSNDVHLRQPDVETKRLHICKPEEQSNSAVKSSSPRALQKPQAPMKPQVQPCVVPVKEVKLLSTEITLPNVSNNTSFHEEVDKNKNLSFCEQIVEREATGKLKRRVTFDLSKNKVKIVSRYLTSWKHGVTSQKHIHRGKDIPASNRRKTVSAENFDVSGDWLKDTKNLLKGVKTELVSIHSGKELTAPSLSSHSGISVQSSEDKWLAKCRRRKCDKKKQPLGKMQKTAKRQSGSDNHGGHRLKEEKFESSKENSATTSQIEGTRQTGVEYAQRIKQNDLRPIKAKSDCKTTLSNAPFLGLVTNPTAGSKATILNNQEECGQYSSRRFRGSYDKDNIPINEKSKKFKMRAKMEKQTFETVDEVSECQDACLGKLIKSPATLHDAYGPTNATQSNEVRRRVPCHKTNDVTPWNANICNDSRASRQHMNNKMKVSYMRSGKVAAPFTEDSTTVSYPHLLIILITIMVFFLSKLCLLFF